MTYNLVNDLLVYLIWAAIRVSLAAPYIAAALVGALVGHFL